MSIPSGCRKLGLEKLSHGYNDSDYVGNVKGAREMFFPETQRVRYQNNPLNNVICQLRFPAILSIATQPPAEYQQLIRSAFPFYEQNIEQEHSFEFSATEGVISDAHISQRNNPNHTFESEDRSWRINLTSNFIAISTGAYTTWEEFRERFELPLRSFIEVYKPAPIIRMGVRYIDIIDRDRLELSSAEWDELIKPEMLGMLASSTIPESAIVNCAQQTEIRIDETLSMVIRAGLAPIENSDRRVFLIDTDAFRVDVTPADDEVIGRKLDTIHESISNYFGWTITPTLREAMKPTSLEG